MKVSDIKSDTTLYFTIDLTNIETVADSITEMQEPNVNNEDTYLVCHIHPNFGNLTFTLQLVQNGKIHWDYKFNEWAFKFGNYMHINWNYRFCNYIIVDRNKVERPTDNMSIAYRNNTSEICSLIRLGWKQFSDYASNYYSIQHYDLRKHLHHKVYKVHLPEHATMERMIELVKNRQQAIKDVEALVDSMTEENRLLFKTDIDELHQLCDSYCNQIWKIAIE